MEPPFVFLLDIDVLERSTLKARISGTSSTRPPSIVIVFEMPVLPLGFVAYLLLSCPPVEVLAVSAVTVHHIIIIYDRRMLTLFLINFMFIQNLHNKITVLFYYNFFQKTQ